MAKMHLPQDVHLRYHSHSRDGRGVGERYGIHRECVSSHIVASFRKISCLTSARLQSRASVHLDSTIILSPCQYPTGPPLVEKL